MPGFEGFPSAGLKFLKGLEKNNDKTWFDANRQQGYDEGLLEPGKALVDALGQKLKTLDAGVHADPKVGGSIFRINRDTRFSKDKRPYKTHFDMWFWTGTKKGWDASGFFLRVAGSSVGIGAGMHSFEKKALEKFRSAAGADKTGAELAKIVEKLRKAGYQVGGEHYKRVPKPFDDDHARATLLKHNCLYAHWEGKAPPEVGNAKFVSWAMAHFKKTAALHDWLRGVMR